MSRQLKKFAFVVSVLSLIVAFSIPVSVKAEEVLDAASTEAMNDLAEILDASPDAKRALREAKEKQRVAKEEFDMATGADLVQADVLKEAKEAYNYVVGVEDPGVSPSGPGLLLPSLNVKAQLELEAAALAVKNAMLITARHPKDTELTEALAKAQKNWDRVSTKVGEIRARIKAQNAPYFNRPSIAMEDERMEKLLTTIYEAAKKAKANTAKKLAAKAKAKTEAGAAVKAAIEALKELKAERDRIRAIEELKGGFKQLRGEVKAVKTAVDLNGETVVATVEGVGRKVDTVGTKVDETNRLLVNIDGKIVDLKTSVDGLKTLMDERTATLITKISGTALTPEDSTKIGTILTSLTEFVASQNAENKAEALGKVEERLTKIETLMTDLAAKTAGQKDLYVQFFDPCTKRWYQINTTTKEVVKS